MHLSFAHRASIHPLSAFYPYSPTASKLVAQPHLFLWVEAAVVVVHVVATTKRSFPTEETTGKPMNLQRFSRYPLTFGPTPIQPLKRLSKHLGGKVEIFAKREDCNSGLAFGGNKTRKLEYLIPDAIEQGCDTLVTIGGIQSNHTRQVAAVAAFVGMKCVTVQENWVNWFDGTYDRVGNILLSRMMGAEVRLVDEGFGIEFKQSWEQALEDVRQAGGKPYAIPAGASDHQLGGLGYIGFAEEVRAQERELGVHVRLHYRLFGNGQYASGNGRWLCRRWSISSSYRY